MQEGRGKVQYPRLGVLIKSGGKMADWQDMDRAYANGAFIPGSEAIAARWAPAAAAFRATARGEPGLVYGPGERQRFDLFHPAGAARGLVVFIHGGYWLESDRSDWSHLTAGVLAHGWACALPSYNHAPAVRISAITQEIRAAIIAASALIAGPIVVTGHSAGGHLAARMGCADIGLDRVRRVVPISPVAELGPLMQTAMQRDLHLTPEECATESPARLALRSGIEAHVWVGAKERPAFLWQARVLSEEWGCPWTPCPTRHHYDVIDDLRDPQSALVAACIGGL